MSKYWCMMYRVDWANRGLLRTPISGQVDWAIGRTATDTRLCQCRIRSYAYQTVKFSRFYLAECRIKGYAIRRPRMLVM